MVKARVLKKRSKKVRIIEHSKDTKDDEEKDSENRQHSEETTALEEIAFARRPSMVLINSEGTQQPAAEQITEVSRENKSGEVNAAINISRETGNTSTILYDIGRNLAQSNYSTIYDSVGSGQRRISGNADRLESSKMRPSAAMGSNTRVLAEDPNLNVLTRTHTLTNNANQQNPLGRENKYYDAKSTSSSEKKKRYPWER